MRIRDLLAPESIQLNGSATGKEDVLNQMVSLMVKSGKIADEETYRKGVFAREEDRNWRGHCNSSLQISSRKETGIKCNGIKEWGRF